MAEVGAKMVSKVAVGELMLILEIKAREWTRRAVALAKQGEMTPELIKLVIEEDSKLSLQEPGISSRIEIIVTEKLRNIMKVSNKMLQSQ